jgi:hypothetical protein
MGKETSTTGDKLSPPEASDVERLEGIITKRDSDNSEGGSSVGTNNNVMTEDDDTTTINDVDMTMESSTAIVSVPGSTTAAEVAARNEKKSTNRSPKGKCDLHHLDSEEEKEEVTDIPNFDNSRDASTMGRDWRDRRPRDSDSEEAEEEEEEETADTRPGAFASSNEQGNLVRRVKGYITTPMVEEGQTLSNEVSTSPSILSEPRKPSARDEQSLMVAELAEPSQDHEELRRRYEELEKIVNEAVSGEAVTGTVMVENDDDDDEDSSICGLSRNCFFLVVAVLLLIIVGVILGVILGVTIPTEAPTVTPTVTPIQSPAPTKAPTAAPTACLDCRLTEILLQKEVSDAEALQDESSPQFQALRWLANNDTAVLDLDSTPPVILVERYVLAMLYFATSGEGWEDQRNFLSGRSVCEWNDGSRGAICNEDDLFVYLDLSKSTHEEVPVLISKCCIDSPVSLPFYLNRV